MREAIEAELRRGNDMFYLNDVRTNRAELFPSRGREERCANNVLRVECKVRENREEV
jgi:hypothetical protein